MKTIIFALALTSFFATNSASANQTKSYFCGDRNTGAMHEIFIKIDGAAQTFQMGFEDLTPGPQGISQILTATGNGVLDEDQATGVVHFSGSQGVSLTLIPNPVEGNPFLLLGVLSGPGDGRQLSSYPMNCYAR